ncbi:lytic transglycosylase domain-containing protein [Candidatus Bealeia paramacronuclearis]
MVSHDRKSYSRRGTLSLCQGDDRICGSRYSILVSGFIAILWASTSSLVSNSKQCEEAFQAQLTKGGYNPMTNCGVVGDLMTWVGIQEKDPRLGLYDVTAFIIAHPDWPAQEKLNARAESMMDETLEPQDVAEWFQSHPPQTSFGYLHYAKALKALGQKTKALNIAREGWITRNFTREEAQEYLGAFGEDLKAPDHEARLERLLWDEELDQAKRLVSLVGPQARQSAEARFALIQAESVSHSFSGDRNEGVLYEQVKLLRKSDQLETAAKLLKMVPQKSAYADKWWKERNYLAREFLQQGRPQDAYALIQKHGLEEGEAFAEAEFLSGFVALRFLNNSEAALQRFSNLYNQVKSPISKSRAAYWAGRAAEGQEDVELAAKWYEKGAKHTTSFYGQLSAAKLEKRPHPELASLPKATTKERQEFESQNLVKALKVLTKMGKPAENYMQTFAFHIGKNAKSTAERHLLVDLAAKVSPHAAAVVAKKVGFQEGLHLKAAYPKINHPHGQEGLEAALVNGLIMQESRFDAGAVSHAGAMGLMQLMPATAQKEAKKMKISHSHNKLHDPKHNVKLGAHHIHSLVQEFDGSYILAIASYNAGKEPVNRWLQEIGDPRRGEIDVVDWLELVPYYETRNYIQRVLENVNVYRAHEERHPKMTLVHDLQR